MKKTRIINKRDKLIKLFVLIRKYKEILKYDFDLFNNQIPYNIIDEKLKSFVESCKSYFMMLDDILIYIEYDTSKIDFKLLNNLINNINLYRSWLNNEYRNYAQQLSFKIINRDWEDSLSDNLSRTKEDGSKDVQESRHDEITITYSTNKVVNKDSKILIRWLDKNQDFFLEFNDNYDYVGILKKEESQFCLAKINSPIGKEVLGMIKGHEYELNLTIHGTSMMNRYKIVEIFD